MRALKSALAFLVISASSAPAMAHPATTADVRHYLADLQRTAAIAYDTCIFTYSAPSQRSACLGQYVGPWNRAWRAEHAVQFSAAQEGVIHRRANEIGNVLERKTIAKIGAERAANYAANADQEHDYGPAPFKVVSARHPITSRDLDLMARDIKAQQPKMHAVCDAKMPEAVDRCMGKLNAWYGNQWRQKHPEIDFSAMAHQ